MKTKNNRNSDIPAIALEGEKALKAAVAEVVAEHKKARKPLAVWYNGKAVLMDPDKAVSAVRESRAVYDTKRKQT
ncbi:MAG: hypothetical protein PHP98_02190 [Kiritimatiellae bacterium]|nr:hypothetical protein [Kiritimatiellia bacterium]